MWSEQLPNGKYKFVERYVDPVTGKTHRVSVTMEKNTAQTRKLAAEVLRRKMDVRPAAPSLTFGELCEMYLSDQKPILKPSTWTRNMYAMNTLKSILGENTLCDAMTAGWIRKQMLDTGKEPGTLNEHLKRLRTVLRWGYDNDLVQDVRCPKDFKDIPHRQKIEDKFLEGEELAALLGGMKNNLWRDVTAFLALSGLRFGEAAALTRPDVDLPGRVIHVTKTYDPHNNVVTPPKTFTSARDVYMQAELYGLCRDIMHKSNVIALSNLFFPFRDGKHISYEAYNHYLKRVAMETIERDITPHTLRHTHASLLMEQGVDVDTIAARLGHTNSRITREIYLHVTKKLEEERNAKIENIKLII